MAKPGRKPTPPQIVSYVERAYAELAMKLGTDPGVPRLMDYLNEHHWPDFPGSQHDRPSDSTVARLIKKVRERQRETGQTAELSPSDRELLTWEPGWSNDPDDVACLYALMANAPKTGMPPLTVRQARWALRLRSLFDDSNPYMTYLHRSFAFHFAIRERMQELIGGPMDTSDLDTLLMHRPWESKERQDAYRQGVAASLIPDIDVLDLYEKAERIYPGAIKEGVVYLIRVYDLLEVLDEVAPDQSGEREQSKQLLEAQVNRLLQHPEAAAAFEDFMTQLETFASERPEEMQALRERVFQQVKAAHGQAQQKKEAQR